MCSMSFSAGPHLKMIHGAAAVLDKTVPVSVVVVGLTARAIVRGRCACAETTLVAPAASTNASAKLTANDAFLISFTSLIASPESAHCCRKLKVPLPLESIVKAIFVTDALWPQPMDIPLS